MASSRLRSDGAELAPLMECSGTLLRAILSVDEATFLIEMVANGAVQGGEFLQAVHTPEAAHRPERPSSPWRRYGPRAKPAHGIENPGIPRTGIGNRANSRAIAATCR